MIQVFVTGNLGQNAELRILGDASAVCSFSIASNRKVKGESLTTWVKCSLWGKRGEALVQHLTKGTRVAVSGELGTHEYDGRTFLDCRVSNIDLMGGGDRSGASSGGENEGPSGGNAAYSRHNDPISANGNDDDIPF